MTPSTPRPASDRRRRLTEARVYLLATTSVARRPLLDAVGEALRGGVTVVQLREKAMPDRDVLALALRMRALCDAHGALFVVNDRVEVARDAGADGVHLGQDDRTVAEARRILGPGAIVGVSTHDAAELSRALADGADYVGVGSVFPTATKGRAVRVSGPGALAPLAAQAETTGIPAFAIGGINAENIADVAAAGFWRIAVSAGILATDDPRAVATALLAHLDPVAD